MSKQNEIKKLLINCSPKPTPVTISGMDYSMQRQLHLGSKDVYKKISDQYLTQNYSAVNDNIYANNINNILSRRLCKHYTNYKEIMANTNRDILRRYYDTEESIQKKASLWRFYQFAIPKPKIYTNEHVKLYYKYFYMKRKFREETMKKLLNEIDDDELDKLDIEYLEKFTKDKRSVLLDYDEKRQKILQEMYSPSNKNYDQKKISFCLSISKILDQNTREEIDSTFFHHFANAGKNNNKKTEKKVKASTIIHSQRSISIKSKNGNYNFKKKKQDGFNSKVNKKRRDIDKIKKKIKNNIPSSRSIREVPKPSFKFKSKNSLRPRYSNPKSLRTLPKSITLKKSDPDSQRQCLDSNDHNLSKDKSNKDNREISTFKIKLIKEPEIIKQKTMQKINTELEEELRKMKSRNYNTQVNKTYSKKAKIPNLYKKYSDKFDAGRGKGEAKKNFDINSIFKQNKKGGKQDLKSARNVGKKDIRQKNKLLKKSIGLTFSPVKTKKTNPKMKFPQLNMKAIERD